MSATVRSDSYLTLHYRITALDGEEFLSTFDMSPATLQMGSGQLAETLESVLIGLPAQEHFVFELEPEEAFGQHNPRLVERIARAALPADLSFGAGSQTTLPSGRCSTTRVSPESLSSVPLTCCTPHFMRPLQRLDGGG